MTTSATDGGPAKGRHFGPSSYLRCSRLLSPAAPYQTVHAVLPHTAFRHHSPPCMRRPVAHGSTQPVDPEAREPPGVESGGPVAPVNPVLVAGQDGHPLVGLGSHNKNPVPHISLDACSPEACIPPAGWVSS